MVNISQEERLHLIKEVKEKEHMYRKERAFVLSWTGIILSSLVLMILAIIANGLVETAFWKSFADGLSFCSGAFFIISMIVLICRTWFIEDTEGFARISELGSLKSDLLDSQNALRIFDEIQAQKRSPLEIYKNDLLTTIFQYQRRANRNRSIHNSAQTLIILFSLFVSGLTSGLTGLIGLAHIPWIAPALSLIVSFLTSMVGFFKFRERSFNLQQTADAIKLELNAATLGIFTYRKSNLISPEETLLDLAERVEKLIDEQNKRQQQLEQPSENHAPSP